MRVELRRGRKPGTYSLCSMERGSLYRRVVAVHDPSRHAPLLLAVPWFLPNGTVRAQHLDMLQTDVEEMVRDGQWVKLSARSTVAAAAVLIRDGRLYAAAPVARDRRGRMNRPARAATR